MRVSQTPWPECSSGTYPFTPIKDQPREVHRGSGDMARAVCHEAVIQQADLHKILPDGARLDVIVVSFRDAAEEIHWVRVAEVIVQCGQNKTLSAENLSLGEPIVGDVAEVGNVGREHLLILGRNEHAGDANKLETVELNHLLGKEAVDDIDSEKQGFGK